MSSKEKQSKSNMILPTAITAVIFVVVIIFFISINTQLSAISSSLSGNVVKTVQTDTQKTQSPSEKQNSMELSGEDHVKGDANAPVTIIEYSDFQCPFCEKFFSSSYKDIVDNYVDAGKVKIIFRHFPLAFHENAEKSAEASECAAEQGMFWEYHDLLFTTRQLDIASLKNHASTLGLDTDKFNTCIDSGKYAQKIQDSIAKGQSQGVKGTPSFLIDGKLVVGAQPYNVFKSEIDAALGQ